jgi:predicted NACHT family NTPase
VLSLLDGLDEVCASADRDACIEVINTFHQLHPEQPLVVCSRIAEYRAQSVQLHLGTAVCVEPLTDAQITTNRVSGGAKLPR